MHILGSLVDKIKCQNVNQPPRAVANLYFPSFARKKRLCAGTRRRDNSMKDNPVCTVYISARLHDTFLLANYPSGAVDIGEGIVIVRGVER